VRAPKHPSPRAYPVPSAPRQAGNGAAIDLVVRLNTALPSRSYTAASIEAGYDTIGTDQIKVDVLYDTNVFTMVGSAFLDDDVLKANSVLAEILSRAEEVGGSKVIFNGRSRVPLAVTLRSASGDLTVVPNHFKSKGGRDGTGGDADQGDGAAAFNLVCTSLPRR
jgi:predicted extracellular nuclease